MTKPNSSTRGRVVVVTGAAQGIGKGIALKLGGSGWHVAVADVNLASAETVAREIQSHGGEALALAMDVRDPASVRAAVEKVGETWGSITALINNAGVHQQSMAVTATPLDEWQRVLAVNLTGVFVCCQAIAPQMIAAGYGRIVNIASLNALSPAPLVAAYNVSKAGVVSLTQTLAYELAPFGVTVNAICPGPIDTETNRRNLEQRAALLNLTLDQLLDRVRGNIPVGRMGTPGDIAHMVAFLLSEDSGFITAATFTASGGMPGGSKAIQRDAVLAPAPAGS